MVWGHNSKTYFYSGTMYWRFDEDLGKVELDYPRDMSMWKGVGYNIDTVFQWKDGALPTWRFRRGFNVRCFSGKTYFFKGKGFWKFNDLRMSVERQEQTLSAPFWMGCPKTFEGRTSKEKYILNNNANTIFSSAAKPTARFLLLTILIQIRYLIT